EDCDAVLQFMGSRAKRAAIRDAAAEWELTRADVVPSAMRKDKARFQEYLAKINPHIKNKVSKKLTFLLKAENIERHDFYGEILCKALCVYHRMIPTKMAEAHVTNRLRASCTTHALNMIESYTTVKRRRMHNDGSDGFGGSKFSLKCESENQTRVLPDMEFSYEDIGNPISSEAHERSFEQLSFDRFISRFNGRRRKALQLLSGYESRGFCLHRERMGKIKPGQDQHDFANRVSRKTFFEAVAEYVGLMRKEFEKFISYIAKCLRPALGYV